MTETVATGLPTRTASPGWRRIWAVVRLHYTDRWSVLGVPWVIFGIIWAVNVIIWLIITVSAGQGQLAGTSWSGAVFYIFFYLGIFAALTMNQTFQFALGVSVTRRDFYLGSMLMFAVHAAWFGAALTLLSYVEQWTGGWGLGGHLFTTRYFGTGPLWQRFFAVFLLLLVCMSIGAAFGASFARWRINGIIVAVVITLAVLLGAALLVGLADGWGTIGAWIVRHGVTGVGAVLMVPAALAGTAGFFVLRGASARP